MMKHIIVRQVLCSRHSSILRRHFFCSPAGLVVDPSTGELDLSSGTVGTNYTITYLTSATDCGAWSSVTLFIDPLDDASFAYSDDHYCATGTILPIISPPQVEASLDPPSLLVDAVSGRWTWKQAQ